MERITSGQLDFGLLLRDKLATSLGFDVACVDYAVSVCRLLDRVGWIPPSR